VARNVRSQVPIRCYARAHVSLMIAAAPPDEQRKRGLAAAQRTVRTLISLFLASATLVSSPSASTAFASDTEPCGDVYSR
jgi:hypothetical protein